MCSSLQRKVPLKLGDISSLPGFATESIFVLEPIIYRYIYMYVDVGVCVCAYTKCEHKLQNVNIAL